MAPKTVTSQKKSGNPPPGIFCGKKISKVHLPNTGRKAPLSALPSPVVQKTDSLMPKTPNQTQRLLVFSWNPEDAHSHSFPALFVDHLMPAVTVSLMRALDITKATKVPPRPGLIQNSRLKLQVAVSDTLMVTYQSDAARPATPKNQMAFFNSTMKWKIVMIVIFHSTKINGKPIQYHSISGLLWQISTLLYLSYQRQKNTNWYTVKQKLLAKVTQTICRKMYHFEVLNFLLQLVQ